MHLGQTHSHCNSSVFSITPRVEVWLHFTAVLILLIFSKALSQEQRQAQANTLPTSEFTGIATGNRTANSKRPTIWEKYKCRTANAAGEVRDIHHCVSNHHKEQQRNSSFWLHECHKALIKLKAKTYNASSSKLPAHLQRKRSTIA